MSDNTKSLAESVEESKTMLGQVWDAVVDGVSTVAHKAVETIQHGVEVAESVGLTVVDAAMGAKDTVVEKTSEVVEVGKEKGALLSEQAAAKTAGLRQVAGEYFEAGKEKAAQFSESAKETAVHFSESAKETAGELYEAGKSKLSTGVTGVKRAAEEAALEEPLQEEAPLEDAEEHIRPKNTTSLDEARALGKELIRETHGGIDTTGHVVVAPPAKQAKESEYVGGWEKVGEAHHSTPVTGTPSK